jgi:hypothetical protein
VGKDPHPGAGIIDAQSVKMVEESAGISGYDGHKGHKGRKRHLLVDTCGLPIAVYVTPADLSDPAGAAASDDLGRCGLPRQGVSRLVPAARRLGTRHRRARARHTGFPSATPPLGRHYRIDAVIGEWHLMDRWWERKPPQGAEALRVRARANGYSYRVQCPGFAFYELYHDQGAGLWVLDRVLD